MSLYQVADKIHLLNMKIYRNNDAADSKIGRLAKRKRVNVYVPKLAIDFFFLLHKHIERYQQ